MSLKPLKSLADIEGSIFEGLRLHENSRGGKFVQLYQRFPVNIWSDWEISYDSIPGTEFARQNWMVSDNCSQNKGRSNWGHLIEVLWGSRPVITEKLQINVLNQNIYESDFLTISPFHSIHFQLQ